MDYLYNSVRITLIVCVIPLFVFTMYSQEPRYTLIDLDPVKDRGGFATAVNDSGQVAGVYFGENAQLIGYYWENGAMHELGTFGGAGTHPQDINNAGTIVGMSRNADQIERAFLWHNGDMQDLGTLGGIAASAREINDDGMVVGHARDDMNRTRAFLWHNGSMTDLGTLGGNSGWATGINDSGWISGYAQNEQFRERGFLWKNGEMDEIGTFGGNVSYATGINNNGQVVGYALNFSGLNRAFLWEDGVLHNLGTLGGFHSYAHDINDAGQIVGGARTATNAQHGFLWEDGVMYDIHDFIEDNTEWRILYIYKILNSGVMVGMGSFDERTRPVMLVPNDSTVTTAGTFGEPGKLHPDRFVLHQNYPNPFNPSTKISFSIPQAAHVHLVVYDILGREVEVLLDEWRSSGEYTLTFNASSLPSGIYLYRLDTGDIKRTKKMMLVR